VPTIIRVLLVEDHRMMTEGLVLMLNRQPDIEVVGQTASATQCREFLAGGGKGGFDISLVDLYLTDGEGIDLIEELREACPQAPVVVLTSSVDPEDHQRVMEAGAEAVLSKAADYEELFSSVRRLCGSRAN
jgi:two-component system response regulator DevR